MKKIISILLVTVMVLSGIPVFADIDDSKAMENVLINVKSKVDIPAEFTLFNPNSYTEADKAYYNFNWSKEDGSANIDISCDWQGRISRYYFYDRTLKSGKKLSRLSKDDIIEFAEQFIEKAVPEASLTFDDTTWFVSNNTYRLSFKRYVNGAEVKDNFADIRINIYDDVAYVKNMNVSYNYDAEFAIGDFSDNGGEFYKNEFPIELIYKDVYVGNMDENKTVLLYRIKDDDCGFVSAVTGERIIEDENDELYFSGGGGDMKNEVAADSITSQLTEQEITELTNVEGVISRDEAMGLLSSLPYVKIGDMSLESYNIIKRDNEYFVTLRYETEENEKYKYLSAVFEGKNGKLLKLNSNGVYDYEEAVLTDEQKTEASLKIDEFLNAVAGEEFAQCREEENNSYGYRYSKDYDRYVDGVRYISDGINVTIDVETGEIKSYSLDFENDRSFDDKTEVVSSYMAYKCLVYIAKIKPVYVLSGGKYVPCYTLGKYNVLLDAFSGNEYFEYDYTEQKSYEYTDIKGHWAEEKITKLAEIQIGFDGDEFNPDAPISQIDLLRLFSAGVYYQSYLTYSEDTLYKNLIYDEILTEEEKNPDAQVLREDAFVYMVRMDGLEKVAKLSEIFKVNYADGSLLSEGKIGYPAILTGLNIICGNGGYLKPKTPITRAEAAVMVYNFMIN